MADNADIRSIEQLEIFLQKIERFRSHLLKEIENLQVELRRLTQWIEVDANGYWVEQSTLAQRRLIECQDSLVRCMSYVREDERKPCSEEKKRLKRAQERRALCEEKLKTIKAAAAFWDRERTKSHSKVQRCRDLAESDMIVAIHHLRGQIERLSAYANLRSAAVSSPRAKTLPTTDDAAVDANLPEIATGDQES